MKKKRVAVLGGGVAAMTTAYHLSRTPELRAQYDVTVFQVGWRLGGKGASGRGPHGRIQEHGLHIFWGFYENAFTMMREAYREMARPKSMPLSTFDEAFRGRDLLAMQDFFQGRWERWVVPFPTNALQAGDSTREPTSWEIIEAVLRVAQQLLGKVKEQVSRVAPQGASLVAQAVDMAEGERLLAEAHSQALLAAQGQALAVSLDGIAEVILAAIRSFLRWLWNQVAYLIESNFLLYQLGVGLDFLIANLVGLLADKVLTSGFNALDGQDYRAWLAKHGANPLTLRSSLPRVIYDAAMSMVDGDPDRQLIAAGSALRALMRICLTYQGHVAYEFTASMGDAIFAPLYEVCRNHGVRFEFFHRVEEVVAEGGPGKKPRVTRVRIGRQVDLKDPAAGYDPFISVKNLPCWPDKPNYDQIVQGEQLLRENIDLESFYTPWKSVSERVLEVGKDFDEVVFGIPVGSVRFLCPTLLELSPAWRKMVQEVASIETQAFQLWLSKEQRALGWTVGSPLLTCYVEPLDTWADMTSLLPREGWAQPNAPLTVAYFCGPLPGPAVSPPPTEHDYPARRKELARQNALSFLRNDIGVLWPKATQPDNPPVFDWNLLVPSNEGNGEARFDTQYWRANVEPSERYTLALPGTREARILAGATGFENLTVCGDWIDNSFYIGAAEGAVISGMQAFRALTGQPLRIAGEAFWYR